MNCYLKFKIEGDDNINAKKKVNAPTPKQISKQVLMNIHFADTLFDQFEN